MQQYDSLWWAEYWKHRFNKIGPIAAQRMADAACKQTQKNPAIVQSDNGAKDATERV